MTTNVWLDHEWMDRKFKWDPNHYGGVKELYVPSETIWLPDIVLYNNADGEYIVTTMTKAILHHDGRVVWSPPAIFKSSCVIDVEYFPFDQQECFMKFGSWSYDGSKIDLKHLDQRPGNNRVEKGINLREYYPSVEWDIIRVPAIKNIKYYPCCEEPYPDIYFNITLRRKTLFYTVNLIIPCVGLEYLSILVFYLPVYSGEKVALCISILLSQTMFFLLISEIMPSTSLAVPLLGKYLLFTMVLVGLSVLVTIIVLNIHYRNPSTHKMAPWVKRVFIDYMPRLLLMRVPKEDEEIRRSRLHIPMENGNGNGGARDRFRDRGSGPSNNLYGFRPPSRLEAAMADLPECFHLQQHEVYHYPCQIRKAIDNVKFIHFHMVKQDKFNEEDDDWAFVAMVLDRLLLWIFGIASVIGTVTILAESPHLYDSTQPIDILCSEVAQAMFGEESDDSCTSLDDVVT
ncbi:acetylcholine receptor subunit alpha-L1-like [Oratosquilla oratoria]|uniref:acetylcholine receptor subunit alpha-L1-like n=1 Tax=Oratosquilla oratoria TaxID=337810 RepID=UPI003F76ABE9